jgi:hypothetical protein
VCPRRRKVRVDGVGVVAPWRQGEERRGRRRVRFDRREGRRWGRQDREKGGRRIKEREKRKEKEKGKRFEKKKIN